MPSYLYAKDNTIIIKTPPCNWRACTFCDYKRDADSTITLPNIIAQFEEYKKDLNLTTMPKYFRIFNSGSFFDNKQLGDYKAVIDWLADNGVERLRVESRPEYVPTTAERIPVEVMIGLETALNNRLQEIRKGFTFEDVANVVRTRPFSFGVYLLAKCYVAEDDVADNELRESIKKALELPVFHVHIMSSIPKRNTELNRLWKEGKWWSIHPKSYHSIVKEFNAITLTKFKQQYKPFENGDKKWVTYDNMQPWWIKKEKKDGI